VTKLNGSLVNGGDVDRFLISPHSNRIVYTADQEIDEITELFVTFDDGEPDFIIYLPFVQGP
jgi:hypothetical protein